MKRILVICMVDSVHSARWLRQFSDVGIEIDIVPSRKYRKVHPEILALIKNSHRTIYSINGRFAGSKFSGYSDFFFHIILSKFLNEFSRANSLRKIFARRHFQFIHCLEIQHAGYLLLELVDIKFLDSKIITTNWGSDIYYFLQFPEHKEKIVQLLRMSDYYSAECRRDYLLANQLGFAGINLPLIPNSGGFPLDEILRIRSKTSSRSQIIIKCYGGVFGRAQFSIGAVRKLLEINDRFSVFLFSVTDDLLQAVNALSADFPGKIRFRTLRNGLSHAEILDEFSRSRIYIGSSISDGISTSFLEALITGCYPIQTNSSCADEWLKKGFKGSTVPVDEDSIYSELTRISEGITLLDEAQTRNQELAMQFLERNENTSIAMAFYQLT